VNYEIICCQCGHAFWTRGTEEEDTNALVLDESDPWDDACEHVKAGGDYRIGRSEAEDEDD
jgi:hypothetical protein